MASVRALPRRRRRRTPCGPEPVPPGVRKRLLDGLNRNENWLDNNTVVMRSDDRSDDRRDRSAVRGVAPFLLRGEYFMLTCLSLDSDLIYHIRIPYVFGPQTVRIQDGDEYLLGVSIDADPPTLVRFYDAGWTLEYEEDSIVPATDCCVLAMWAAGFIDSPGLSRYVNLVHNEAGRFETVASSFGDDLIVERMIGVGRRAGCHPRNRASDQPRSSFDDPVRQQGYAHDAVRQPDGPPVSLLLCDRCRDNRGGRIREKRCTGSWIRSGLRREPHSVAMLFINEHALVLTHTGERYERLELQMGYRQEAYDYLILRNRGQAYLYFYLTPGRRGLAGGTGSREGAVVLRSVPKSPDGGGVVARGVP
jgi:hypothetical protein